MMLAARFPFPNRDNSIITNAQMISANMFFDESIKTKEAISKQEPNQEVSLGISGTWQMDGALDIIRLPSQNDVGTQQEIRKVELQTEGTQCIVETQDSDSQSHILDNNSNSYSNLRNEECMPQLPSGNLKSTSTMNKSGAKFNEGTYEWDNLRKEAFQNNAFKIWSDDTNDSLDYEAVRNADVNQVADAIRERGQHNNIAARIKVCLQNQFSCYK